MAYQEEFQIEAGQTAEGLSPMLQFHMGRAITAAACCSLPTAAK
jgi:hypothetical protein